MVHALIWWLSYTDHVTDHELITWLSCTDHVADRALITWLIRGSTTRIAAVLQRKATSLASTRDRLVRKGMIYSSRQGVVSFTVPLFGDFLRRKMSLIS